MPKRPIYPQPADDNPCRSTRRDLEFLCNYWDRLLAPNQSRDVRLPELLRANHLMRHLSSLLPNRGLRVNVSFTILDDNELWQPEDAYAETYQLGNPSSCCVAPHNSGSCRSACSAAGCDSPHLRDNARRMSENYAAMRIERELARAGLSVPFDERDGLSGCRGAFCSQWLNDSPMTASQHYRQDPRASFCATLKNLQQTNNIPRDSSWSTPARNDSMTKRSSRESKVRRDVSEAANVARITPQSAERHVEPDRVAINNDERSIDPQPGGCQANAPPLSELNVAMNRGGCTERQERAVKRKLNDRASQDRSRTIGRIGSRVKGVSTIPRSENIMKIIRSRIKSGRSTEVRPSARRHASAPKYASFLRMFHKKETDESPRGGSSEDENEKSQGRGGLSSSASCENQVTRDDARVERRTPTPKSTVHTTYNPIMHSSASDPILDSNGLATQLLRLAVLLYTPALLPTLNSLIAQQNRQTAVSMPSFEESNDPLTTPILPDLLNQSNFPFVSISTEGDSSPILTAETNASSRPMRAGERTANPIATEESSVSRQECIGTSSRARQDEEDKRWRLTSIADSATGLDRNVLEDFWRFEELLQAEKRPTNAQSLSARCKNEIVTSEYFQDWLHRLPRQPDAYGAASTPVNSAPVEEAAGCSEGSTRTKIDESSLRETERQRSKDRLTFDKPPDSSRDNDKALAEHEEEDSDDQRSFTSVASANSSRSL